jgi:peptidoglycan hydrolase-like protein with peptidoglycan-binding domain
MKSILKPIALKEKSYNVNLLHAALAELGLPVAKREVASGKAGSSTLRQVRALQAKLKLPVDDSVLVDEATALRIHIC